MQRGTICTSGTTCGNDRNLLDFIDITLDSHGRVLVGYADGCIDACVTDTTHNSDDGPADAQAAYATIARQSSGKTLLSAYDAPAAPTADVRLVSARAVDRGTTFSDTFRVKNTGPSTVKKVLVAVRDNNKLVGSSHISQIPAGETVKVTLSWPADRSRSTHEVVVQVDPKNNIAESDETDNVRTQQLQIP